MAPPPPANASIAPRNGSIARVNGKDASINGSTGSRKGRQRPAPAAPCGGEDANSRWNLWGGLRISGLRARVEELRTRRRIQEFRVAEQGVWVQQSTV
eukprot:317663-Rhodomonas_salina.1